MPRPVSRQGTHAWPVFRQALRRLNQVWKRSISLPLHGPLKWMNGGGEPLAVPHSCAYLRPLTQTSPTPVTPLALAFCHGRDAGTPLPVAHAQFVTLPHGTEGIVKAPPSRFVAVLAVAKRCSPVSRPTRR